MVGGHLNSYILMVRTEQEGGVERDRQSEIDTETEREREIRASIKAFACWGAESGTQDPVCAMRMLYPQTPILVINYSCHWVFLKLQRGDWKLVYSGYC